MLFIEAIIQNYLPNRFNLSFMQIKIFCRKMHAHVFVVIHKISNFANFTRDFLKTTIDSGHTIKTKNAPCFLNFLNINKNWQLFSQWTGSLKNQYERGKVALLLIFRKIMKNGAFFVFTASSESF